ncbi:stage III sporulation protein AD [Clostridia bacterium]|nr:stage III sporulation protein AD [Clostridia bacterium]
MDMIKIALLGIGACLLAMQIKAGKPEFEHFITLAVCLCIFFFLLARLQLVVEALNRMQGFVKLDTKYMAILLKMIGITYVAEFSGNICKDAGYHAVASQIEMFGKLSVLAVSMPVLLGLMDLIGGFLK